MRVDEGTWSHPAGFAQAYRFWTPDEAIRGVAVLLHGYAEHGGRYGPVAEVLVDLGLAVYAPDHRGHGRSEGERALVWDFDGLVEETIAFLEEVAYARTPRRPRVLIGHSMGGALAALVAARRPDLVDLLVLSGPAVRLRGAPPPLRLLAGLLGRLAPRLPVNPLPADAVSRDPETVARYDADPLNYRGRVKARTGAELLRAGRRVLAEADRIQVPTLILQGGADRLVSPEGARRLHERLGARDRTLRIYRGLYHEVFNEPERPQVLRDLRDWLVQRLELLAGTRLSPTEGRPYTEPEG